MCARRILPIAMPEITSYPHIAYPLSVTGTEPEGVDWLFSNYVQLNLLDYGWEVELRYFIPCADLFYLPGLFGSQHVAPHFVRSYCPSFVDFARRSIDQDLYVWTNVDEFYIPGTRSYSNQSFEHPIMLHGYDDEYRVFHMSGYLENQRYVQTTVSYEAVEAGFSGLDLAEGRYVSNVHLLRKSTSRYEFKTHWIIDHLREYAGALPSDHRMEVFEEKKSCPWYWGIGVIDGLQHKLKQQLRGETFVDHRPFYILLEHKRMMRKRIAYMADNGHFAFSGAAAEGYREVELKAQTVLNLELKYLVTRDGRYLEQLIDRLGALKETESEVLGFMLDEYDRKTATVYSHLS